MLEVGEKMVCLVSWETSNQSFSHSEKQKLARELQYYGRICLSTDGNPFHASRCIDLLRDLFSWTYGTREGVDADERHGCYDRWCPTPLIFFGDMLNEWIGKGY